MLKLLKLLKLLSCLRAPFDDAGNDIAAGRHEQHIMTRGRRSKRWVCDLTCMTVGISGWARRPYDAWAAWAVM
jgi:hypothetical protein